MVDARSDPPYGPESGLLFHSKEHSLHVIANHKVLFGSGFAELGIGKQSFRGNRYAKAHTPRFRSYYYALTCSFSRHQPAGFTDKKILLCPRHTFPS
uniref:Uncharacterized protein n=1 Tax=Candidatus Kentrum sp. UNK TaxID=2126344 RepID=A0A451ALM0_9GAMM|nr:MAG: hypothetical protein BECKUNK1418G_GA0071005_111611 [Candidatus Kentron sp. UNK]